MLTHHPTNVQVKNIITKKPALGTRWPWNSSNLSAPMLRIAVITTYATPLSGAPSITQRLLKVTVVRSPIAGLDATASHIPTHRPLLLLPEDTLRSSLKVSENVVYAIDCRTCNKIHMGNWQTLRWPFSRTSTLHAITWHRPPRWPPLYIPSSQRRQ